MSSFDASFVFILSIKERAFFVGVVLLFLDGRHIRVEVKRLTVWRKLFQLRQIRNSSGVFVRCSSCIRVFHLGGAMRKELRLEIMAREFQASDVVL